MLETLQKQFSYRYAGFASEKYGKTRFWLPQDSKGRADFLTQAAGHGYDFGGLIWDTEGIHVILEEAASPESVIPLSTPTPPLPQWSEAATNRRVCVVKRIWGVENHGAAGFISYGFESPAKDEAALIAEAARLKIGYWGSVNIGSGLTITILRRSINEPPTPRDTAVYP